MKFSKKVISIFSALMMIIVSVSPITVYAEDVQINNELILNDEIIAENEKSQSEIQFANLFFTKNEDVEKIIAYYDYELANTNTVPATDIGSVNYIIGELQLNTNCEETICIIQNIFEIDEYVDEEKINKAIQGIITPDNIDSFFYTPEPVFNPIQPAWGSEVHNNKTTELAKSYFSDTVAAKIGKYNREVDLKYSSGIGAITGSPNQYIHFNEYASGSEDSRDYAAATWFVASELAWDKGQTENAYMYLGYALHPLQDKESHGQIGRGKSTPQHIVPYTKGDNITHADDVTGWEWTNTSKNALKAVGGSKVRYNKAVSVTKTWLSKYKEILK